MTTTPGEQQQVREFWQASLPKPCELCAHSSSTRATLSVLLLLPKLVRLLDLLDWARKQPPELVVVVVVVG